MQDDILTIDEVAQYLRVSERTVYDWAQKGEIPAGKIGTVWRFKKDQIEKFVNDRLSSNNSALPINLRNIVSPLRVAFLEQESKHDVIIELAEVLSTAPQIKRKDELIKGILQREELMSTAIGHGIAIPHVRISSVTDVVMAVGICKKPILDFGALDDSPVKLIFMIAAAYNQHNSYLKAISELSGKLKNKDFYDKLCSATNAQQVYDILVAT